MCACMQEPELAQELFTFVLGMMVVLAEPAALTGILVILKHYTGALKGITINAIDSFFSKAAVSSWGGPVQSA